MPDPLPRLRSGDTGWCPVCGQPGSRSEDGKQFVHPGRNWPCGPLHPAQPQGGERYLTPDEIERYYFGLPARPDDRPGGRP